jgi:uncharacterized membrane protein YdjX (TVP38/TMEM64 family)
MVYEFLKNILDPDFWINIFDIFNGFEWVIGIILPSIEAIFPPLPLAVFVTINVMVFGFWKGYLFSWIGTCLGSILVYMLLRRISNRYLYKFISNHKRAKDFAVLLSSKGIFPMMILLCFPFTPSFLIIILSVIINIKYKDFILMFLIGKLAMIFVLNFIGYNISSFIEKPYISIITLCLIGISMYGAKKFINFFENKYAVSMTKY